MRDFADTLEARLASMAAAVAEQTADEPTTVGDPRRRGRAASTSSRRVRRRGSALLGGVTAGGAAVAAFFALGGTSLADLPILHTATTDATSIRSSVPTIAAKGVDFERAHVFHTNAGPGYVMTTADKQTVCLAIPDGTARGSFGASCAQPLAKVERAGLAAEIVGDLGTDPKATSTFAFVLPEHAEHPRLVTGGATRPLVPEAGVVVASITTRSTVRWTVDGREGAHVFTGPFAAAIGMTCPNGKGTIPAAKVPTRPGRGGGPPTIDMRALERLCR